MGAGGGEGKDVMVLIYAFMIIAMAAMVIGGTAIMWASNDRLSAVVYGAVFGSMTIGFVALPMVYGL